MTSVDQVCAVPYDVRFDDEQKRMLVMAVDPLSLAEVIEMIDDQAARGAWHYSILHDARAITWVPTADEIRRIVDRIRTLSKTHGARGPIAFVADNKAVFGMARMYELLGDRDRLRILVTQDFERAQQWLVEMAAGERAG